MTRVVTYLFIRGERRNSPVASGRCHGTSVACVSPEWSNSSCLFLSTSPPRPRPRRRRRGVAHARLRTCCTTRSNAVIRSGRRARTPIPTRPAQQGAHCLQRRPRRMRSCSGPISPAPPLAAFSAPTRATTSRRNPTTDIPPPSGLCSSSNSRPDLRRRRPVRCHHHAVGGSPIPRTGRELPKL